MPAAKAGSVKLDPEPAIAPGLTVQLPTGKLLSNRLPVETEQLGCELTLTVGADGVTGWVFIITSSDITDVQPAALVTVKA